MRFVPIAAQVLYNVQPPWDCTVSLSLTKPEPDALLPDKLAELVEQELKRVAKLPSEEPVPTYTSKTDHTILTVAFPRNPVSGSELYLILRMFASHLRQSIVLPGEIIGEDAA